MSSSRHLNRFRMAVAVLGLLSLAACTVEPLNARNTQAIGSTSAGSDSVRSLLNATMVAPASSRVAQQVRNELLFAMHGGGNATNPKYSIQLIVTEFDAGVAVEPGVAAARASQVTVYSRYKLINLSSRKTIASGIRSSLASYNRTPQLFANQRSAREAENRAAKAVAQQIKLVVAQELAKQ